MLRPHRLCWRFHLRKFMISVVQNVVLLIEITMLQVGCFGTEYSNHEGETDVCCLLLPREWQDNYLSQILAVQKSCMALGLQYLSFIIYPHAHGLDDCRCNLQDTLIKSIASCFISLARAELQKCASTFSVVILNFFCRPKICHRWLHSNRDQFPAHRTSSGSFLSCLKLKSTIGGTCHEEKSAIK